MALNKFDSLVLIILVLVDKTLRTILVLDILLPTADVITDLLLIYKLYRGTYQCNGRPDGVQMKGYSQCAKDSYNYCSDPDNNQNVCGDFKRHDEMARVMLAPFCLNYIFCFIAFFRLGTNKRLTFIFPLLNLYPQFGK